MLKKIGKSLIIYVVIFMTILSNVSFGYSSKEVGSAVAGYSLNLLDWGNKQENFCNGLGGYGPALRYNQLGQSGKNRNSHPTLEDPSPATPWFWDCSSFASNMYNMVCNKNIFSHEPDCDGIISSGLFETVSSPQPGDVLITSSHVEIYISDEYGTGGAHSNHLKGNVDGYSNSAEQVDCAATNRGFVSVSPEGGSYMRLKESVASEVTDLNTEFSISGTSKSTTGNVDYSKFFFNGIPDGKYSLASSKNIFEIIIDLLANIVDYLIGIITYIVRIVFVGFTAIFDNLLSWTVNTVVSTGTSEEELNISGTEIEKTKNSDRDVTLESMIFNRLDFLDIDIFK